MFIPTPAATPPPNQPIIEAFQKTQSTDFDMLEITSANISSMFINNATPIKQEKPAGGIYDELYTDAVQKIDSLIAHCTSFDEEIAVLEKRIDENHKAIMEWMNRVGD